MLERSQFVLLTGRPGTGKTTLLKEVVALYPGAVGGFYTEEVREGGTRVGFDIVTLDRRRAPLARAGRPGGRHRVSRYRVDVEALERVGVRALRDALDREALLVVDEIGRMELFSQAFRDAIASALEDGKRVLGTILLAAHPWADELKRDPRVSLLQVTRDNHQEVRERALDWLREEKTDE